MKECQHGFFVGLLLALSLVVFPICSVAAPAAAAPIAEYHATECECYDSNSKGACYQQTTEWTTEVEYKDTVTNCCSMSSEQTGGDVVCIWRTLEGYWPVGEDVVIKRVSEWRGCGQ